MPAFDDFIPAELEAPNRELATWLEQSYQQPSIIEEAISPTEQKRILIEARAYLLSANPMSKEHENTPPLTVLLVDKESDTPVQSPVRSINKRRFSRTARVFNTLAAVLAVMALIAGSVALFTNRRTANSGANPPIATTAPCLPANTIEGVGLDYICTQHLYQDLHLVQSNGQYRITLTKGYADQGQVLVWYQVEKKVEGQYQLIKATDVMLGADDWQMSPKPDNTLLDMGPLSASGAGITGWDFSPTPGGSSNQGIAKTTDVQLDVAGIALTSPHLENVTFPTAFHFRLSLPVNGSWQSESLQQTEVASGHSLTLHSVGYSLSLVDISLKSSEPSFSNTYNAPVRPYGRPIVTSFKVGNVECILNPKSHFYQGSNTNQAYKGVQVSSSNGEFWQNLNCSLAGARVAPHSEVTLVVSMYATAALYNTALPPSAIWTFHFQLP